MIHVVTATAAKQRNSFGASFDLLAIGPQSMATKMRYRKDNLIPFHSHPNQQIGYLLSGRIRVLTRDAQHELGPATPTPSRPTWSKSSPPDRQTIPMLGFFNIFAQLDPLLRALTVIALIAFVLIVDFPLWRYVQKRRMRKRADLWVALLSRGSPRRIRP